MKRNLLYIPGVLLLLSACSGHYLDKGINKFEEEAYAVAAEQFDKSYDKKKSEEAVDGLINSYLAISNYEQAEKWLKKAIEVENADPAHTLKLAQVLVMNGKCEEGEAMYAKYKEMNPVAKEEGRKIGSCDVPVPYNPDSTVYNVEPASVNTRQSNFGATYYKNGIVFTSQRPTEGHKVEEKTNMPYMNLYFSELDENGELKLPKQLADVNTKFHQGPATFGMDGNLMIYAASRVKESGVLDNTGDANYITLMQAENVNGAWTNIRQVFEGSPTYSMSHPYLADNGTTLYFSSDMPGGKGGTDIYMSSFKDGKWSSPVNVEEVNTIGSDEFPSLWANGSEKRLYFSSNGIEGALGGMDIYYMVMKGGMFDGPYHMTAPINSSRDDFNLILTKDRRSGYLSSNRYDGKGIDYLYKVDIVDPEFIVQCTVIDEITEEPLKNATVTVLNKSTSATETFKTDGKGMFSFAADMETAYQMNASATEYVNTEASVTTVGRKLSATINKTVPMQSLVAQKISSWENIYYDYNRSTIRKKSKETMNTIIDIMKEYPEIRIELNGYADVRGDFMYNIELSQKRADRARDYLIKNGIAADRIVSQGLGETNILNHCKEGVECTNDEHQINRRTEFRAIK